MSLKPDAGGYGSVTKTLHWVTFVAIRRQFVVGYAIDRADDLLEGVVDIWFGGEEEGLIVLHAVLGVTILALTLIRLYWKLTKGLPAWAPSLTEGERRLAHRVEVTLYTVMILMPLTGLALLFLSGESWDLAGGEWEAPLDLVDHDLLLPAHIVTHIVFFVALATHVGLVLKHQLVNRDRLLSRML